MSLIAQLKSDLNKAEWALLQPHLKRDAVIIVNQELDIITVAEAVVNDDTDTVKAWMDVGKVQKPKPEQIKYWDDNPDKNFVFLIVQPYVLIQEMSN